MKRTFRRFTLAEFIEQVLKPMVGMVNFDELHIHGTDRPSIADFRRRPGEYYMYAMYRAHLGRGFSDIAQHATIDPDGYIWDGRSLLQPPASATNYNDSDDDRVHPFMFEMIGQFDVGRENLEGAQLAAAAGLSRAVIDLFGSRPVLHREMTDKKTCPGSSIKKDWFLAEIAKARIIKVDPPPEVKPKMDPKDANKIITFLQAGYNATEDKEAKAEFKRLANELRKASGQPTQ